MIENPPCKAGDLSLTPGQGTRIPHATEQLSLCATTLEPVLRARELQLLKPKCPSAHAPQQEKPPQ